MANRNITLSMPDDLIRRAKIESAKREVSISALIRQSLERELRAGDETIKSGKRFLALARRSPIEMPKKLWRREDLHE